MAQYFEPSTDTDANFANSVSGQAKVFSYLRFILEKFLTFSKKIAVEAITNTDYAGEISLRDSVKIIKNL